MLTQLSTIKSRLAIPAADLTNDDLLTSAIASVTARFDKETNRTLARRVSATHEFDATDTEILPPLYPIETVTKWETKSSEAEGWKQQPVTGYLIRAGSVISLSSALSPPSSTPALARLTYTGGYVLPGTDPALGQTPLPDDLEQAAVEQVAYWFETRDKLGLKNYWPSGGIYLAFTGADLLPSVKAVLASYQRWTI